MSLNSVLQTNQSQTDLLVESYKATQQNKIDSLTNRRTLLQSRQSFYTNLNTRINSLSSQIDKFKAADAIDKFFAKSVTSSDASIATASSKSDGTIGNNTLKVNQLASNDLLITSRLNLGDNFGEDAGDKTFEFTIGDVTKEVSVTFDGTETNEQAMKKIVQAINSAADLDINAAFVKDTTTTGRLSLTAKNTGSDNRIRFSESTVLDKLGLNPTALLSDTNTRVLSTETGAGFRREDFSDLDAKFELNSINITRGSNTVTDVLDGLTINLLKTQEQDASPITLSTTVNTKSVEDFVKGLLTSINDVMSSINQNKDIRRNDSAVTGLLQNLRNVALTKFTDSAEDGYQYLVDVGIKFDNSGFLVISDSDKFKTALESDPQKLADLFSGENGIAKRVEELISPFKGNSGLVSERNKNLKTQIDSTSKRLADTESRIETQANALRRQYQSYLKLFYEAQNQNTYLSGFITQGSENGLF
ncbi:MAG: flagellar filament capping protein FliD [Candidatus Kapabacteria bacterium]|nr:flagellar filament capping protein FliD [Ignavibacteriota bacterium]MCW5884001.1 flagellar filament capping protein FliD [Candidatus Kapabacteria bacterium]